MNIDFDAMRDERVAVYEPLQFTLGGRKFKTQLPLMRDVLGGAAPPEKVADAATTASGRSFLTLAQGIAVNLPPKDRAQFWKLLEPGCTVDIDGQQLIGIAAAITEHHQ